MTGTERQDIHAGNVVRFRKRDLHYFAEAAPGRGRVVARKYYRELARNCDYVSTFPET